MLILSTTAFCQEEDNGSKDDPYTIFYNKLITAEELLQHDYIITPEDMENLESLNSRIQKSIYRDLESKCSMILFLAREKLSTYNNKQNADEIAGLLKKEEEKIKKEKRIETNRKTMLWASAGQGLTAFGLFNYFRYKSEQAYDKYINTTSPEQAALYQKEWQVNDLISLVCAGAGFINLSLFSDITAKIQPEKERNPQNAPYINTYDWRIKSDKEKLDILHKDFNDLQLSYKKSLKLKKTCNTWTLTTFGIGISSLIGMGVSTWIGKDYYEKYNSIDYSEDAVLLKEKLERCGTISAVTGIAAVTCLSSSLFIKLFSPKPERYEIKMSETAAYIEYLK